MHVGDRYEPTRQLVGFSNGDTLTLGRPEPENLSGLDWRRKSVLLALARASRHPLSQALRRTLESEGVAAAELDDVTETPGMGMRGRILGKAVSLGRADTTDDAIASRFEIEGEDAITIRFRDLLRPGAILINTARGAILDEAALVEALRAGRIGHAGLDVFADEPLPENHPLTRLDNVTLTSHAAFMTEEASARLLRMALELLAEERAAA